MDIFYIRRTHVTPAKAGVHLMLYYVYITASRRPGTLYIGMTNDLVLRVAQHKSGEFGGFASKFGCDKLVWFDFSEDVMAVIQREKQLKAWKRAWKVQLIKSTNPEWRNLYYDLLPQADK